MKPTGWSRWQATCLFSTRGGGGSASATAAWLGAMDRGHNTATRMWRQGLELTTLMDETASVRQRTAQWASQCRGGKYGFRQVYGVLNRTIIADMQMHTCKRSASIPVGVPCSRPHPNRAVVVSLATAVGAVPHHTLCLCRPRYFWSIACVLQHRHRGWGRAELL